MRDLVLHSIGGGWGSDGPTVGAENVSVIRGADFPSVSVGVIRDVPTRWEKTSKLKSRTLEPDDIILESSGGTNERPTGRTLLAKAALLERFEKPVIPASFCRLIRIDSSKADPRYVFWWLQNMHAQGRTWNYQNRSTGIANFQFENFLDSEVVLLPDRNTQHEISSTLGALEDKIESNIQVQVTIENLLRSLVNQALGSAALDQARLSDYCDLVKDPASVSDLDTGAHYISFEHMPKGSIALNEWGVQSGLASSKSRFRAGDILFGKLRPYFKKVGLAPVDGVSSNDVLVLRPKNPALRALVAMVASSDELIDHVSAAATGTRMPRTSWEDVSKWEVPRLSVPQIENLGKGTLPLVDMLVGLVHENRRLVELRDALLPELLSGRIRFGEFSA